MSAKLDPAVQPKRDSYVPPAVVVLGTVTEVTAGIANPGGDLGFSPPAVSDRRLKQDRRPLAPVDVLGSVAEFSLV